MLFMLMSLTGLFCYLIYYQPNDKLHIGLSIIAFFIYLGIFIYVDEKSRKIN